MVEKAVSNAEIDVPAPMVEEKLDEMMQQMNWRMQQQGFTMEQYMKILGQSEAQMRDMYRGEAENNVRSELVMEEIIKAENIEADEADVEKLLEGYTAAMGQTVEQLKSTFSPEQLDYFKHRAQINKAIDLMWQSAKITDEEIKPEAEKTEEVPEAAEEKADNE